MAKKTQVVHWLMEREDWDLLPGRVRRVASGRALFLAPPRPILRRPPPEEAGPLQHALRDVYVALDQAIGDILDSADDRTTVFLVSGDGMGPNYSGSHILADLLTRMGLLKMHSGATPSRETPEVREPVRRHTTDVLGTIRGMIPERVRIAVSKPCCPVSWRNA